MHVPFTGRVPGYPDDESGSGDGPAVASRTPGSRTLLPRERSAVMDSGELARTDAHVLPIYQRLLEDVDHGTRQTVIAMFGTQQDSHDPVDEADKMIGP